MTMERPIVIPLAVPFERWREELYTRYREVLKLEGLLVEPYCLCLFCLSPVTLAESHWVTWNAEDPWTLELPDGRRLPRPPLRKKEIGGGFAICATCAQIIAGIPTGYVDARVWARRCDRCWETLILVPRLSLAWYWRTECIIASSPAGQSAQRQEAYLCLACQRKLWKEGKRLPYYSPPELPLVTSISKPGTYFSFQIRRRPEGLPTVYDAAAGR